MRREKRGDEKGQGVSEKRSGMKHNGIVDHELGFSSMGLNPRLVSRGGLIRPDNDPLSAPFTILKHSILVIDICF